MIAQGSSVLRYANDRFLNDTKEVIEEIAKYFPSPDERRTRE
ncbi:MAG: hypothetical protein DMF71_06935 [Acidobacteria bacterium]|nr:MAG: hypothetical protein DMF71_06935 [Acidobacteriota bacterium]